MKPLLILLMLLSINVHAEEECIFDESVYLAFINQYASTHKHAKVENDKRTLRVDRNNEKIVVTGGGCVHLGVAIDLATTRSFSEQQFLHKTLELAYEFGRWLINTSSLESSIKHGKYQVIDGVYFVNVDAMTVFSASHDGKGVINIEFYIN